VILRAQHLDEARLFDCYLAECAGDGLDPRVAEHLADCPACGVKYAELARFMDSLRADGEADADEVFTPERLRAQQQQIARRIEQVGRPARVLSFPGQLVSRTVSASGTRALPRWTAAAAAAGLFIGIAVGASYEWDVHAGRPASVTLARDSASRPTLLTPIATRGSAPVDVAADDAFLSDLEAALEHPRTRELLAFDALTPHVREIRAER
jgi:anti-sigma factor RsiW